MECLEGDWLVGQHHFLIAVYRSVVCHRKEKARGGTNGILVVKLGGVVAFAGLCLAQNRFRFHLCLFVPVDSVHPQPGHPLPSPKSTYGVPRLWKQLSAAVEFLSELRRAADADYFLAGTTGVAAGCVATIPYFLRIGWKSG